MVDTTNDQDVPKRMMDMLRMFLAASSAGEHCVFVLESKNKMISTKYRSVEVAPGTPVHSHGSGIPKKKNPAGARRSKLRLEEFLKKKREASKEHPKTGVQVSRKCVDAGATSNTTNQLICDLKQGVNSPVETRLSSKIPQVDGEHVLDHQTYVFKSDYALEDVEDTLNEILPDSMHYGI